MTRNTSSNINNVLIQGAGRGLGLALAETVLNAQADTHVIASARDPDQSSGLKALRETHGEDRLTTVALDITDDASIKTAREQVGAQVQKVDTIIICAGLLHDENTGLWPEKKLGDIDPDNLAASFAVNATGPMLMIKHFHDLLPKGERGVIASLSARVGSISDNGYGGWYAYRASKAAQNQLTKTASIELARRSKNEHICVGLHPGTVDTNLSEPFQSHVPDQQLQAAATAADHLLAVVDNLTPDDTGQVFDWAGSRIEP